MASKIPQHFLDDLLARIDIVTLIERYIPLKKIGNSYQCICPFHNDSKPSMHVIPHKQFYYCFSCGASGNAITFLMEYEHLSFLDCIDSLASDAGVNVPKEAHANDNRLQPIFDVLMSASSFYQQELQAMHAEKARAYLNGRGLDKDTISHFGIGFVKDAWDSVLKKFAKSRESKQILAQAGLLIEKSEHEAYDRFRGRIMFPIRDQRGRVIGFGGRVINDGTPKYLNSPETIVFHKGSELYGLCEAKKHKKLEKLLVVEGYMDVISLYQHGIDYAVATLGTAVTAAHLQRLIRSVKHIVFCFDGDGAGLKAAWKALTIALPLVSDEIMIQFLFLPKGDDPDSIVQKIGCDAFEDKIKKSMTLSSYLFDELSQQVNLETLEGRAQLVAKSMPFIQETQAIALREQLLQELAKLSNTTVDTLSGWQEHKHEPKIQTRPADIQQTPVRFAITLALQHPECAAEITPHFAKSPLKGLDILENLLEICKKSPHIKTAGVLEYWRGTAAFKYLNQLAASKLLIPYSSIKQELTECVERVRQLTLEHEIDELFAKANRQALTDSEKNKLQKLLIYKKTRMKTAI